MAKLMNLLGGRGNEEQDVLATLQLLEREAAQVRIEVENTSVRFQTHLTLKSATVIVAKPAQEDSLAKGGTVRFQVPNSGGREVRMEVLTPHFTLSDGQTVFLCRVPKEFAPSALRGALRFDTAQLNNVSLGLPGHTETYRVIDLSANGCSLYLDNRAALGVFPVGHALPDAVLHLGADTHVRLSALTPRNHRGQAVGCQFVPAAGDDSLGALTRLLKTLEQTEQSA